MARQSNDKIWNDFVHWCRKRHLKAMPAHPWTIAAFLRWMDSRNDGDSAESALKSISRAHLLCGRRSPHGHPMIERTMGSIYRRRTTAPDRSDLFEARDFLAAADTRPVSPPPHENNESDDVIESLGDSANEAEQAPPAGRRHAMRSQPRLVSRRRI